MSTGHTPQSLYRQAKSYIEDKLRSGEWKPGDMIPSENRLVVELGMSRMTVNRAMRELADDGLLVRRSGKGTFVADRKPQSSLLMIAHLADEIRGRGHRYDCRVLLQARESASLPVAAALGLPTGSSVFHITCVHFEEDVPVQLEDRFVNPVMIPDLLKQAFGADIQPSLYLQQVVAPDEIEHIVDASMPSPAEVELLQMDIAEPCLVLIRRTWSQSSTVTYARFVHPSSRYRLGGKVEVGDGNRAS